jgi:hypothetical protein
MASYVKASSLMMRIRAAVAASPSSAACDSACASTRIASGNADWLA